MGFTVVVVLGLAFRWAYVEMMGGRHIAEFEEPTVVTRLELRDSSNRILWRLDARKPRKLRVVDYGVIPDGYMQITPAQGLPRPLVPRENLLLVYSAETHWTRHWGYAVDASRFRGGMYYAGPLSRTTPERVFADGPTSIDFGALPDP